MLFDAGRSFAVCQYPCDILKSQRTGLLLDLAIRGVEPIEHGVGAFHLGADLLQIHTLNVVEESSVKGHYVIRNGLGIERRLLFDDLAR